MLLKQETIKALTLLGLPHDVDFSIADVENAYRRLAKLYHPDLNKSKNGSKQMVEINFAYTLIKDNFDEVKSMLNHEQQGLSINHEHDLKDSEKPVKQSMSFFEKYLTIFVLICMILGVLIGLYLPSIPLFLGRFEVASVNLPIGFLIWLMIYPMMLKIDFSSVKKVKDNPKGLYLTWVINWLIKPLTMFGIASLFFLVIFKNVIPSEHAENYLAGAVLLGAAPCTAMVFVWSSLTRGNPAYTLVQVATNDLIILVLYVPIVGILLGIGGFSVPWVTLFLSVFLFVVVPLAMASVTRYFMIKKKGLDYYANVFIPKTSKLTVTGLLITLILIFSLQADLIVNNPAHILWISIPLIIQTFLIFFIAYFGAKKLRLSYDIAAPAGMIGASNFFELAVAVAIAIFPHRPGVALATIVGVLVEVPIMLMLVKIANKTKHWFEKGELKHEKN